MKKVLMLIMSCVAAISFIGCSAANPQSDPNSDVGKRSVRIMIGYENNPGEPIDLACQEWKRLVEEKSNGSMRDTFILPVS